MAVPRVISRPEVTYDLTAEQHVTITLPSGSPWSSGLHWHETHDEYLKVIKGTIKVRLGSETLVLEANGDYQPEVKVAKYQWHEWRRDSPDGDDVIVEERTDPDDGEKALFFWNLNGVLLHSQDKPPQSSFIARCPSPAQGLLRQIWTTLNLFVIFHALDNVPVLINFPGWLGGIEKLQELDYLVSKVVLYVASWVGWFLNARAVRAKYTPTVEYTRYLDLKKQKGE